MRRPSFSLGLLVGLVVGVGCWHRSSSHCANLEGDQTCAERGAGAYCSTCITLDDGCVDEVPDGECYFAGPSGTTSSDSETAATTAGVTALDPGTETEVTTGPIPCVSNADYTNVEAPFCGVNGKCGTCEETEDGDAACAGLDPSSPFCLGDTCVQCTATNLGPCIGDTPVCDGPTNTCVQCTVLAPGACAGDTPVCNDATNTCEPCIAHSQCGEAACNLYTGACLPADAVVHVGGDLPDFPDLNSAVDNFASNGAQGTIIVHDGIYNEAVTVDANGIIAFLASADATMPPRWIRTGAGYSPQLTVNGGATVLMAGLQFSDNTSSNDPALMVGGIGSRAWLDRSRIVLNSGNGIVAEGGAELTLRNCFVGNDSDAIGLEVTDASATVLYSTLTATTFGATPALRCNASVAVEVRNSIVVTRGGTPSDEVDCIEATITYSATEGGVSGQGNVAVGTFPAATPEDWFLDYTVGDFHFQNDGFTIFADIAQWQLGDPPTDIDGDLRPAIDGTPDYAGADVP